MFLHYRERTYHTGVINRTLDTTKKEFFFGQKLWRIHFYSKQIFFKHYSFPSNFYISSSIYFYCTVTSVPRSKQSLQFVQECFYIQNYYQVYVYEFLLVLINIIMFIFVCLWNYSVIWSDIMLG